MGKFPDHPGIQGTGQELPRLGLFHGPLDVFQDPPDFGGAEIGVREEAGFFTDKIPVLGVQIIRDMGGPPILPNNGVVYRLTGKFIPDHAGFPLIIQAYAAEGFRTCLGLF